jgi:DNA replication protein DnaC
MARPDCPRCEGTGFVVHEDGAASAAVRCACTRRAPDQSDLLRCGLPQRYLHCTLDNYRPVNNLQRDALAVARAFAEAYPAVDRGILFTGHCGVGKTHLAAAVLRELVIEQGVHGVFADYQDLLKRIQLTFSRSGDGPTEEEVIGPVLEAEVLVLDDLGARRTTPWAEETISHLLSVRYNENRVTLITTNLQDIEAASEVREHLPGGNVPLSERVSERVLSRLHEMCRVQFVDGPDHRRSGRSAAAHAE